MNMLCDTNYFANNSPGRRFRMAAGTLALCVLLPAAGMAWSGLAFPALGEFPPRSPPSARASFEPVVFAVLAVLIAATLAPFLRQRWHAGPPDSPAARRVDPVRPFPSWGWAGLLLTGAAWTLAWTRFPWFAPLQRLTFTPLWLGFILTVNAWTWKRAGGCPLTRQSGRYLALFPVSAAFWWLFEYLNRYVGNWQYAGVESLSAIGYALEASCAFSTVLPAFVTVTALLATWPRLTAGLDTFRPWRHRPTRGAAAAAFGLACAGLAGLGRAPRELYPLLWVGPLALALALEVLAGRIPFLLAGPARGDWRAPVRFALAALICGFFWEMWNEFSLAKWVYSVPYVDAFHLFEMPALGYAGYLPFGLECAWAVSLVWPDILPAGHDLRRPS